MASYVLLHHHHHHHAAAGAPVGVVAPPVVPVKPAPAGTFVPGTKIQVGSHRIVVQKYLSEGGFAHVYLVKLTRPVDGTDVAVLKRVAVPDKDSLRGMRTEVETMKRLKGHRPIVTYIDSHASELLGGGYEVFLLMEYCGGGGLIDFMNTRLQHRLTEPEILAIFTDVAEGVACMHYLKPPLLHRDLKVENVLIAASPSGPQRRFKLCDFGSAAPPRPAPRTHAECCLVDEDIQKHTTLQYRSPEMIDVYRKQPLDEKSDIWALGVLLYKLCYYTTPFEEQGQLAILNASFRYPSHPTFSDRLKKLIGSMLKESQQARPNIYQVLREACAMQGREVPIKDIYTGRASPEPPSKDKALPGPHGSSQPPSPPVVGAVFSPAAPPAKNTIPEVVPMRRGRPPATASAAAAATTTTQAHVPHAGPTPVRINQGDPFAALDSKYSLTGGDERSARFPTMEQFSLLHDQGVLFNFDSPAVAPSMQQSHSNQGVAGGPADGAFAAAARPKSVAVVGGGSNPPPLPPADNVAYKTPPPPPRTEMSRAQAIIANNPELQAISSGRPFNYVSTGTMTVTPPEQGRRDPAPAYAFADRPENFYRVADPERSARPLRPQASHGNIQRTPSFSAQPPLPHHKSFSSRPSLEDGARPDFEGAEPAPLSRPLTRARPSSTVFDASIAYPEWLPPRGRGGPSPPNALGGRGSPPQEDATNVESNVDFLRSMEEPDPKKKHGKRGSSLSLSGTKNILAGKFGDAFKRFEGGGGSSQEKQQPPPVRMPSPLKELERRTLTPIAGSEAVDGRSDDGYPDDAEDMTPEMRRELERLRLCEEERRVEAAQAEYRRRLAQRDGGGSDAGPALPKSFSGASRAASIQNRVQNLLNEEQRNTSSIQRTAQGYGKYTDVPPPVPSSHPPDKKVADLAGREGAAPPNIPWKPISAKFSGSNGNEPPRLPPKPTGASGTGIVVGLPTDPQASVAPFIPVKTLPSGKPPAAPRKPFHLNSMPTGGGGGVAKAPSPAKGEGVDAGGADGGDHGGDFSKRFPGLGAIEMVERDLDAE